MKLADLLPVERIVIPLPAKTLHDAAEQLITAFVETGDATEASRLVARVTETPPEEAVQAGDGAFILHVRSDAMVRVAAALGVTAEPVVLTAESERSARIVVLVAGPPKETATFLQTVTAFAHVLDQEGMTESILAAQNAEAVVDIPELLDVELPGTVLVGDILGRRRPRSVHPEDTLHEVAQVMQRYHLGSVPVASDDGEVLGMVSTRDLIRAALPPFQRQGGERTSGETRTEDDEVDLTAVPVRDVMDRSVLCITEDQNLADVANLLVTKDVDKFPVVRDGVLVGMLTRAGILRLFYGT